MAFSAYPTLFQQADQASIKAQRTFLRLTQWQAALLIMGTILSVTTSLANQEPWRTIYNSSMAVCFFGSLIISLVIGRQKYEKTWYQGRALAESIKSASWLYMMRADILDNDVAKNNFGKLLNTLLSTNDVLKAKLAKLGINTWNEITQDMRQIRAKLVDERTRIYLNDRIMDQKSWYEKKAKENEKKQKIWFALLIIFQSLAILFVLIRILPITKDWQIWPIDVFTVITAFVIGWIQLKRFNELAAAYSLTVKEISFIEIAIEKVKSDQALAGFVSDAEKAFSREHTQWTARK